MGRAIQRVYTVLALRLTHMAIDGNPPEISAEAIYGVDRQQWGRWKLDSDHQVLACNGYPEYPTLEYPISLKHLKTSADIYAWIRQLESKTWCTEEDLGHFVRAAFAIVRHQSVLGTSPAVPPR